MIESSRSVRDNMLEIQSEYIKEIDQVLSKIRGMQVENKINPNSTDLSVYDEPTNSDSKENPDNTNEHQQKLNFDEISSTEIDAPTWAKRLWKEIAKECHPDKLHFHDISEEDKYKRHKWFIKSRKSLETKQWNTLLHIGVQLEIWVIDLTSSEQISMLNAEYSALAAKIQAVQDSLAWKWGTNWENTDLRIKILELCLTNLSIAIPERLEMIKLLANLELE